MLLTILEVLGIIVLFKLMTVGFDILDRTGEKVDLFEIIKNKKRKKENKNDKI